jgi:hypothetical protein
MALMRIAQEAGVRPDFSSLIGRAPAGRILRLRKTFKTATAHVCQIASPSDLNVTTVDDSCINPGDQQLIDDKLEYTTRVPANNVFDWIVTPSTRPFEYKAGKREAWTLTCEDAAGKVYETQQVTIWRGEVQSFDLPCGGGGFGTASPPAPTTVAQAESLKLVDRLAPSSSITRKRLKATRSRVSLSGRATDTAPRGLTPRIAQVRVAIARRTGKLCRFLDAQGRFGAKRSCKRTQYVVAHVKKASGSVGWSYGLGARLPRGRYLAWSRALDAAGNIERKAKSRNLARFTVR